MTLSSGKAYLFFRGVDSRRIVRHSMQDDDGLGGGVLEILDHAVKVEPAGGLKGGKRERKYGNSSSIQKLNFDDLW